MVNHGWTFKSIAEDAPHNLQRHLSRRLTLISRSRKLVTRRRESTRLTAIASAFRVPPKRLVSCPV